MKDYYLIGRVIKGVRAIYNDELDEAQFRELTHDGLPANWFTIHLAAGESRENSERAKKVCALPVIVSSSEDYWGERIEYAGPMPLMTGGTITGYTTRLANPRTSIKTALFEDQVWKWLFLNAPAEPISTKADFIDPLAALVMQTFHIAKSMAFMMTVRWARSQPECIVWDRMLDRALTEEEKR